MSFLGEEVGKELLDTVNCGPQSWGPEELNRFNLPISHEKRTEEI